MRSFLMVLALMLLVHPAQAEPVFEVLGAHTSSPDQLYSVLDVGIGEQFEIVVLLQSPDSPSSAAEFYMTELLLIAPGVFKLSTHGRFGCPVCLVDLPSDSYGEYVLAFGECLPAGADIELLRAKYGTFGGPVPPDTVIELRGLQPGDTQPSSFDGNPGIVDCEDVKFPGAMGGHDGGYTESGVVFLDGSLGINLTLPVVPAEVSSLSTLKGRY